MASGDWALTAQGSCTGTAGHSRQFTPPAGLVNDAADNMRLACLHRTAASPGVPRLLPQPWLATFGVWSEASLAAKRGGRPGAHQDSRWHSCHGFLAGPDVQPFGALYQPNGVSFPTCECSVGSPKTLYTGDSGQSWSSATVPASTVVKSLAVKGGRLLVGVQASSGSTEGNLFWAVSGGMSAAKAK